MKFRLRDHLIFLTQGILLFGINYWLVYLAERFVASGLIAVIFSLVVITNAVFGSIFLRARITWKLLVGGILAVTGTALIFKTEVSSMFGKGVVLSSVILGFLSLVLASLGNVFSAWSQKRMLPLIQMTAFSMLYGSLVVFLLGLTLGKPVTFKPEFSYVISLFYLAIFGSIIAFVSYLKIIGRIGPARGSYALVMVPLVAMIVSTIFESYHWERSAFFGMPFLILGNMIAMDRLKPEKLFKKWK